jgi:hypothetical protein
MPDRVSLTDPSGQTRPVPLLPGYHRVVVGQDRTLLRRFLEIPELLENAPRVLVGDGVTELTLQLED